MHPLDLHGFHQSLSARFVELNGMEAAADYGDWPAEHAALTRGAGLIDLSFRGRVCLVGTDRIRFLHGQVTNDVKRLRAGHGCYAALVNAKGKMQSDLFIHCLENELLLDFEPGLVDAVSRRLEHYIVADDVQVVNVSPHYGLLSVQGPGAKAAVRPLASTTDLPDTPLQSVKIDDPVLGEIYLINQPRLASAGFDVFAPAPALESVADKLIASVISRGGRPCGWQSFEAARIEAGIPRFGADMDDSNLPQECGIESRAVSYNKGCYIGQEVINRIHTMGHVNKRLCRLELSSDAPFTPAKGDRLFCDEREAGFVTSATSLGNKHFALGYLRREFDGTNRALVVKTADREAEAKILGEKGTA